MSLIDVQQQLRIVADENQSLDIYFSTVFNRVYNEQHDG